VSVRSETVTKEQAEEVAAFIQKRLDSAKLWSITVSPTRKVDPNAPDKYRILIHGMSEQPVAIYSARILRREPVETVK
jgi:hypothetical protein